MSWRPTPKSHLIKISRYDREAGDWGNCEFKDLRRGDLYAAFALDGERLNPATLEPTGRPDLVALRS